MRLPLSSSSISTSVDYERYFEAEGERFHHILSPKTGKSASEVQSVSVLGPESVYTDALSTAVFVLGLEKGIGLINALDDFDVIVMDNQRKLHYSNGLLNGCSRFIKLAIVPFTMGSNAVNESIKLALPKP